jgi:hypothetical protein
MTGRTLHGHDTGNGSNGQGEVPTSCTRDSVHQALWDAYEWTSLTVFRKEVCRLWRKALKRRSQKHRLTRDRMKRLVDRWLPPARVCHPYPLARVGVIT